MANQSKPQTVTARQLREEARRLLDELRTTTESKERRRLAVRAYELVQQAEKLLQSDRQNQATEPAIELSPNKPSVPRR